MIANRNWDVVVIGAGVAGSLAAYAMARRGGSVLLADRAAFPRSKVCGCCLSPDAQTTLVRFGLGHLTSQCHAVQLKALRLATRGHKAHLPLTGWVALSRTRLDDALVASAQQAGATFLPETNVRLGPAQITARGCTLHRGVDETEIQASVVFAADGLGSRILSRDALGSIRLAPGTRIGAGIRIETDSADFEPQYIYMACGPGGYVGLVRLEDGRLNLAAALDIGLVHDCGGTGAAATRILTEVGWPTFPNLAERSWRGTVPLTRRVRRPAADRLLAIGDAAGYVEPFTGDGMAWAMSTAENVAAMLDYGWSAELPTRWSNWHHQHFARRQRVIRAMAWMSRRSWLTRMSIGLVERCPKFSERLLKSVLNPIPTTPPRPPSRDRSRVPRMACAPSVESIVRE